MMEELLFQPIDVAHFNAKSAAKPKTTDWNQLRSIARFENRDAELLTQVAEILGTAFTHGGTTHRPLLADQFLALAAATRAVGIDSSEQTAWIAALLSRNLQRHVDAEVYCRLRVAKDAGNWEAHAMLGEVLTEAGQHEAAVESLEHALRLHPRSGRCRLSWLRALGDAIDFGAELQRVEKLLDAGGLCNEDHVLLLACKGYLCEKLDDFQNAFLAYRESNERKKRPAADDFEQRILRNRELYSQQRIRFLQHAGTTSSLPVFIIGMPRSGTTLLERNLAAYSGIYAAGELEDIGIYASRLGKAAKLGDRQMFDAARWAAEQHLHQLQLLSTFSSKVVDKMPTNFQFLGLIASLFPQACVIWLRRDWRDVAVSCFSSNLAWPFASLEQCRAFIRTYDSLMRYWVDEIGLKVHTVRYEDLVNDPEAERARLSEACGLATEPAPASGIDRYVTRTPSRFQVRQSTHRRSVGRWERFAPFAGKLLEGDHA